MLTATFVLASLLAIAVNAAPGFEAHSESKRQSITPLSFSQISSFTPYTYFASAAYCNASTTINWSCGCTPLVSFAGLIDH